MVSSVSVIALLAVAPVGAERSPGTSSDSTSGSIATTTAEDTTTTTSGTGTTETTDSSSGKVSDSTKAALQAQAKTLLVTERQDHKEHTTAQRQQSCQAHQAEINTRAKNYAAAAQRHLDTFNSIFTKVQAFQTSKQLNVTNYDTLVAAATAKQTAAQTAVDALKSVDTTLDCTQADPANQVAALKTAVINARTALQDYRAAIKDVIVALKGASTSTSTSTSTDSSTTTSTGGNQ
jgi:hypothetical protein